MKVPRISAVLSIKNRPEYLRECLDSLRAQTMPNWECIIIDDYSTCDLESIVSSYNDTRFRYYKNNGNPGIASARNMGNSLARSEWIAVVDSDDINLAQRFERSLTCLASNPSAKVFYSQYIHFDIDTHIFRTTTSWRQYDRELLYDRNYIAHPTAVYHADTVREFGYNQLYPRAVDYDLWLSFADRHIPFIGLEESLVIYRKHGEQTANVIPPLLNGKRIVEHIWEAHLPFR